MTAGTDKEDSLVDEGESPTATGEGSIGVSDSCDGGLDDGDDSVVGCSDP